MTKKKKHWLRFAITIVALFFILFSIVYLVFIRDWNRPVPFPVEEIKKITCFQNRSAREAPAVLNSIYQACGAQEQSLERESVSFIRKAELEDTCADVLSLEYIFWYSPEDPLFQERPFQQLRASRVNVSVYPKGAVLETWPSNHLAFASNKEEIEQRLDENYGQWRPLYRLLMQSGSGDGFSYEITPYDRAKNEFCYADGNDGSAYAFLTFGEYQMNLDEWTQDSKRYACLPVVLQDLADLLQKIAS